MLRRAVVLMAALLVSAVLLPGALGAARIESTDWAGRALTEQDGSFKIAPEVAAALQNGGRARALIVLQEQADVSGAAALATKRAKGRFVFDQLREVANRTQPPVRALLDRLGLKYRAYYVVNMFAVEGLTAASAQVIAALPEVGQIEGDPDMRMEPIQPALAPESAGAVEWGVQKINAVDVWEHGFRGTGIVVANQDTGVQWDHPALKGKYRGWKAGENKAVHSYNWWDAIHNDIGGGGNDCGFNLKKPCDDEGHGTHTMGTIVGSNGSNQIGVAPRSKWIACRNMDDNVGRPSTYIECFEFFLAPWNRNGQNPKPAKAPDVVSNSWGCPIGPPPQGETCTKTSIKMAVQNVRAAGIFVAASAGNDGPGCYTINSPIAMFDASVTVGATDINNTLAGFSSRGPVTKDGSNRLKPDLSAPGVSVRSSYPTNTYAVLSGTSMASPHVAGAVALLWDADPALLGDVDATEALLTLTANPGINTTNQECGHTTKSDIPNNLFGYGLLDVGAAYEAIK